MEVSQSSELFWGQTTPVICIVASTRPDCCGKSLIRCKGVDDAIS